MEQARWLIEYHNRRADAFAGRAVALLGFIGVILALLNREGVPGQARFETATFWMTAATVASLLISAAECLYTLRTVKASAPGEADLRDAWSSWANAQRRSKANGDIAESFLRAKKPWSTNPVGAAIYEANFRAKHLKRATLWMFAGLVSLSTLLLLISTQLIGGR